MSCEKDTSKCTQECSNQEISAQRHTEFNPIPNKISNNVLQALGKTPLIRVNKIGKEENIECQILAKCEFMNMGGSIKDRIGARMIEDAEIQGRLKKGDKIVEATSGNTGIGLALAAAVKGYQMIITLPEKMSNEKVDILKGLGAKVIRTPTQAASQSDESNIGVAKRINKEQGAVLLDQYSNPSNPLAHYDQTAQQILYQCDGKLDALVVSVGTGGAITGLGRKIHEKSPNTIVVGVDPHGSILALPETLNVGEHGPYKVQGIGYDFIPGVLDRKVVDQWVKISDVPSFKYARDLIQKEGLLCGGSSGSTMYGALEFIKSKGWDKDPSKRVVVVLSDGVRNYITKFLSKQWCIENRMIPYEGLKEQDHIFNGIPISDLKLSKVQAYEQITIGQVKKLFEEGKTVVPLKKNGEVIAAVFPHKFLSLVLLKKLQLTDSASKIQTKDFVIIPDTLDCAQLERLLQRNHTVLVESRVQGKLADLYVATQKDILKLYK